MQTSRTIRTGNPIGHGVGLACLLGLSLLLPVPARAADESGTGTSAGAAAEAAHPPLDAPRLAQELRLSAEVLLEALVDTSGEVRATNILRSHPVLDDSAAMYVRTRRFEPARDSTGRSIPGVRLVPVNFASRRPRDAPFGNYVEERRQLMRFEVVPELRPDSTGRLTAHWSATGTRSHELRLLVLTPDGVEVEPTPDMKPQRLLDGKDAPGWPAWRRSGKQLKAGTSGDIALRLPSTPWWTTGRIAFVAVYSNILDGTWVVRQAVYRIETDAFGPLLVRDAGPEDILAGSGQLLAPRSIDAHRRLTPPPNDAPLKTGVPER